MFGITTIYIFCFQYDKKIIKTLIPLILFELCWWTR